MRLKYAGTVFDRSIRCCLTLSGITAVAAFLSCVDVSAATVSVPAGGNLQEALNAARPGDVIELAAGATYVGNFVLPAGPPSETYITVRTVPDPQLPAAGARIQPADAPKLAKLRSPDGRPALQTAARAHHWRLELLEFLPNEEPSGAIVSLGEGSSAQSQLTQVPHDIILDRAFVHGHATTGQRRGIALNSASTTITGCYVSEIKAIGFESQAIAGWNGPGPFTISNNYLEAAGENVLFGGGDPSIPNLVPRDITIIRNKLSRPVAWRGQKWEIKNILELKNARKVTITDNILENNWQAAQAGFAVLFTVRNQEGRCAWCQVEDVVFERNVVRHSGGGVSILGLDEKEHSEQTRAIAVRNNLFLDIDNEHWGGNGYFMLLTGAPRDIVVDHNTIIQPHSSGIVQVEGPPVVGFVFTNNIVRHGAYGIMGSDHAPGADTIKAYFPAAVITHNVIADGAADRYPPGNRFPSFAEFRAQFVHYDGGDFRLSGSSGWKQAGSDRTTVGADVSALPVRADPDR
jgi:hypothetical protein